VLRAFLLTGNNNTGGKVGEANGGISLVDMLPAGTSCTVSVDTEIFVLNFNIDIIVYFSDRLNGSE
jgi:hypothetical protein